ncbi:Uncharacterised protein [Mycobacteroides abscessus subsp. abscessus]|nr:Uncharacterised protein [Mycobacteroides abscessus subsp. abscessus]
MRVTSTLARHQVTCGQQTLRQGSLAAGIEPLQPTARDMSRASGRQQHGGILPAERDDRDLVAALIGITQQGQGRAADCRHLLARGHGPRGIDHKDHQVAFATFPYRPLQIGRHRSG